MNNTGITKERTLSIWPSRYKKNFFLHEANKIGVMYYLGYEYNAAQ